MAKRSPTIEHVNGSLARWKTRLKRAMTAITKLEAQKKRIEARPIIVQRVAQTTGIAAPVVAAPEPVTAPAKPEPVTAPAAGDNLDIPTFLRREKTSEADKAAAAAIKTEAEAKRKLKARGRIEKLKAKKAGDMKRMPLTGKAALDLIRNG